MATETLDKLSYYDGFNDGVHACFGALSALIEGVNGVNDIKQVKMMIASCGNSIAEIMETTSAKMDSIIKEMKED